MTEELDKKSEINTGEGNLSPCVCCLGTAHKPVLEGLEQCLSCGHIRANLSWTPEMFRELYTERYFKGGEYTDYEKESAALRLNFRKRLFDLAERHPDGGNLWEIGCAYGFFLQEARIHFNAAGCDVVKEAVQSAIENRRVNAYCLNYLSYTPPLPFDVICLWDTVEHLPQPDLFLEKAFKELKPGGTLALSTGDIGSCWARLRGKRWRLIHPPTHVHYFTRQSMYTLLTRLGYTDIHFHYHAFWRNMNTVMEKLASGNKAIDVIYSLTRNSRLLKMDFPLNLFDLMTVYAKKP